MAAGLNIGQLLGESLAGSQVLLYLEFHLRFRLSLVRIARIVVCRPGEADAPGLLVFAVPRQPPDRVVARPRSPAKCRGLLSDSYTLNNGLRLVVNPIPHTRAATIEVVVAAGFGYEGPDDHGLGHLVEHMLFKGTARRPGYREIAAAIESLGGVINAATDREVTAYYVRVPAEHLPAAAELLGDVIGHSTMAAAALAVEQRIIVDELITARDTPEDWVGQLFDEMLWPDHGVGRRPSDGVPVIQAAIPEALSAYLVHYYGAANMVVSVAGRVDAPAVRDVVESAFGGLAAGRSAQWPATPSTGSKQRVARDRQEGMQVNFVVGGRTFGHDDPDRFALDLLSAVLVEGMGSRLFAEIREERALAYDIGGGLTQFRDTGSFAVGGAVAGAALEPALETILATCRSLADNDLPEPELRRARGYVKGGLILGMEDSFNVASWFAREELLETERLTPEQAVERIDAVTLADIRRVAKRIFAPGWAHLALVGPVSDISGSYRVLERGSGVATNVAG